MSVLQRPPQNVPFLSGQPFVVDTRWLRFMDGLIDRSGGYEGQSVAAGNGISVSVGVGFTVSIDGGDENTWTAKQTFSRAIFRPAASVTPANNGDVEIQLTDNTHLAFRVKGSDGTVRTGTIVLA